MIIITVAVTSVVIEPGLTFTDGQITVVTCQIGESHPPPGITWLIDSIIQPSTSITTNLNPNGTTTSIFNYLVDKSDNTKTLYCTADNNIGNPRSDSKSLDIKFTVTSVTIENKQQLEFIDGRVTPVTCQIGRANPSATITWTTDSITQPSTSIITNLNSDETTTSIFNYLVDKSDNTKTLYCIADNNIGNPRTDSKSLDIKFRPSVNLYPSSSPSNIIKGRELVLTCIVSHSNPPVSSTNYTWKKNDIIIQGQRSDSYRIVTVNIADKGSYTCSAENTVGSTTTTSVTIDILYGPTLSVSENTVTTEEHSEVRIRCTVKSNPQPRSFIWIKPDNSRVSAVQELLISSIKRNQAGVYKCEANVTLNPTYGESEIRTDNQLTDVKVLYLDPVTISSKTIIEEGDELNITCSTNSFPVATITWYNDTAVLDTREINSASYTKQDGASCMDSNTYSCKAINTELENREMTNSTTVIVKCSPRQDPRVIPILKVTGRTADVIDLVADVISYPPPSFTWYYIEDMLVVPIDSNASYQLLNTNSSINTYKSTLKINITSNYMYRTYTVNVSNEDGGVEVFYYSVVGQTVPNAPNNLNISTSSLDKICVEWKPGFNGGATQTFIVQHSTDNITWIESPSIPDSIDNQRINYCITDLKPETQYYIRLMAINRFGTSQLKYFRAGNSGPIKTNKGAYSKESTSDISSGIGMGIGIGIGISVGVVLLVFVSLFIYRRLRRGEKKEADESYSTLNRRTESAEQPTYQELNDVRTYENVRTNTNAGGMLFFTEAPNVTS